MQQSTMIDHKRGYNAKYGQPNYFHYRKWLYKPFIESLVSFAGLRRGASVLDVGCGQGLFSHLFHNYGMNVHGIDLSEVGIQIAREAYGRKGLTFEVADIRRAVFNTRFDCIFVRSCSLYNNDMFAKCDDDTTKLLSHLTSGGIFIFCYYTNFSGKQSQEWRYHSLDDIKKHFRRYSEGQLFFSNKVDTLCMGRYAFNSVITRLNVVSSRLFGIGGDAVYLWRKA